MKKNKIIICFFLISIVGCSNKKQISLGIFEKLHYEIISQLNSVNNVDSFVIQTRKLLQNFNQDTVFFASIWSNANLSKKTIHEFNFCNDIIKGDRLSDKDENDMKRNGNILYDIHPEMFCYRRKMLMRIKYTKQYECETLNNKSIIKVSERMLEKPYQNRYEKMWLINIRTEIRKDTFIETVFMIFKKENEVLTSCSNSS